MYIWLISILSIGSVLSIVFTMFWKSNSTDANKEMVPPIPDPDRIFTMPAEDGPHEGTWLQWPHNQMRKGWLGKQRNLVARYERSWIDMTLALHKGEKVHIIVYDDMHHKRVKRMLQEEDCNMNRIDFSEIPTDDVWIRDNGPVFVFDENRQLHITDWGFNGWGGRYDCKLSDEVPKHVAENFGIPITTIPMINEGGSIEVDGRGTLMAKKSSILNRNRNRGWKQSDAEAYFQRYLGVTNFIWLEGKPGLDITDDHIDGTARFAHGNTIVTYYREDFLDPIEYDVLKNARDVNGEPYIIVHLPLTNRKCVNGDYGFYINYYVGNEVLLVPSFDADPNDEVAKKILQDLYPDRSVITIPMREVLKDGGMMHCVTQQQPRV